MRSEIFQRWLSDKTKIFLPFVESILFPHLQDLEESSSSSKKNADGTSHFDPISAFIDHTLLKPTATREEIKKLCEEALLYGFIAVCVNGSNIDQAVEFFKQNSSRTKVAAVVGFPLGAMTTPAKYFETTDAIIRGAHEIDMVINMGRLKDKDYEYVLNDIKSVVEAANGRTVKVILECGALTKEEIIRGTILSVLAGADFVKTSTGFGFGGAKPEDVRLMKFIVGSELQVKASGGVRSREDAKKMIECGASRIGTSSGVTIVSPISPTSDAPSSSSPVVPAEAPKY